MPEGKAICTLDYLVGTLATAYKGVISSLVIKDFCMVERESLTIFKGTIFSIPEGSYHASLMNEGIEISRGVLRAGYFELQADSSLIATAKNLQIDIVQNGRHIGTFLLKREKKDGFFISALELSEEIRDINFGFLTHPLSDKVGLSKKAEDVIAEILSTKQNWKKLSEQLNSFSKDLFWFDRKAYYLWFDVLVRWSLNACARIESDDMDKAVSNVLSLIELPIENEADREKLRFMVDAWLRSITESRVDLSAGLGHCRKVLSRVRELFPETDIAPALQVLVRSLIDRVNKTPALTEDILQKIKSVATSEDHILMRDYGESRKKEILESLSDAHISSDEKRFARVFEVIDSADSWLSKNRDMVTVFFDVIERNMTRDSAESLSGSFTELFIASRKLPADIYKTAIGNTVRLMRRLLGLGKLDVCEILFMHIEKLHDPLKTDIVLNTDMASTILEAGGENILGRYKSILEQILIPAPNIAGHSHDTWAEIANPLHLERLSKFLDILRLGSGPFKQILVRVICNIYAAGVFVPDDRLFQRDVSKYLNSVTMQDDFLLHYILLKKLPVYYHEVGATGRLRDDSTEIDSWGNDPILYFIRKQVHVNSSNHLIQVIEEVMKSWVYGDPEVLERFVPEEILKSLDSRLIVSYSSVIRPFFESTGVLDADGFHFEKIIAMSDDEIDHKIRTLISSEEIRLKLILICRIYRELVNKYSLFSGKTEKEDIVFRITEYVLKLRHLKGIILSPEKTNPEESLYFKRHIAFGIPSVMGSYHEPKFDALGELLRIEEKCRSLIEAVITDIKIGGKDFSEREVRDWVIFISALNGLLELHGLSNFQIDEAVVILKENNLFMSQVIDLLKLCQREISRMVELLTWTFHRPLVEILEKFTGEELPEFLRGLDPGESNFINKAADIVMRAIMAGIAGFFELDGLINNFIDALNSRMGPGADELLKLSDRAGTTQNYFTLDGLSDTDAMASSPLIGNKAKNLIYLRNKRLIVPEGVVFPADKTQYYREYTGRENFRLVLQKAVNEIEERTGAVFGGKRRPLFLSVRSGSYISMPGILSSILYCGVNEETVHSFVADTNNPWLAWDSYRRFIEHYGTAVYDLDISIFEEIVDDFLREQGMTKKEDLSADQMSEIVRLQQRKLNQMKIEIPDDVYEQLKESVKAVYRSWFSERSLQFRRAMAISDHWGTAVALMQMIPGNDRDSGASVFFTRKPLSLDEGIYGDTKEMATGGELVYGRSVNRPIARQQALSGQTSLEETDPELFLMHEELARSIERAMRGLPQEVEATYTMTPEGKRIIYVLQTRNMEFFRGFTRRFDDICRMQSRIVGRGVGVYGGALSGVVTFSSSPEDVRDLIARTNLPVILLRREASTDDVSLMSDIDGIVTAAGGATSHAAVLAQKFRLTAIVGCSDMKIEAIAKNKSSARIGNFAFRESDHISIDGSTGLVYSGLCFSATKLEP